MNDLITRNYDFNRKITQLMKFMIGYIMLSSNRVIIWITSKCVQVVGYQRVKGRKFGQCIHTTGRFFCFRSKQNVEYKGKIGVGKTVVYTYCLIE